MAVRNTSLSRVFAGTPLPVIPVEVLRKIDPMMEKYVRDLHQYLQDLSSGLIQSITNGLALPPIPDITKDYVLVYEAGVGYHWIETTTDCPA